MVHRGHVDLATLGAGVVVPHTVKSSAMHDFYHHLLQQQVRERVSAYALCVSYTYVAYV
jgi:hypothetical protein